MSKLVVRPAVPYDYATFARLFCELGVDDPVPAADRFASDFAPTTLVAERDGVAVGYTFYRAMKEIVHVAHLVTAPEARRGGVGRTLMQDVARRVRATGTTKMQLNVKPSNEAAIRLYEGLGLARLHLNHGLKLDWKLVDDLPDDAVRLAPLARAIEPSDDDALEAAWSMPKGMLAEQRARPSRVLRTIASASGRAALAVFDPGFPGTNPFRAPDLLHALSLIRGLRHAASSHVYLYVAIENQPELARALVGAGAKQHMETLFMRGPLPS